MSGPRIGAERIHLATVDSTNKHAAELLERTEVQHGTVILADAQTEGRGRRGGVWRSMEGRDLTFSVVVLPIALPVTDQLRMAMAAALAVREAVAQEDVPHVRVKWPNDILIEERKVAGILIQNDLVGDTIHHAILGIGVNVNSTGHDEKGPPSTSIRMETGRDIDRLALLERLLNELDRRWTQVERDPPALQHDYIEQLWGRGRWLPMELDGHAVEARPIGVDRDGRLLVELNDGRVQAFGMDRLRFGPR